MNKTRQLIIKYKDKFPNFDYYVLILDEIDGHLNSMPDISIEACKSLVEGISKTILTMLKVPFIEKGRNIDPPVTLLKKVLDILVNNSDFELAYAETSLELVNRIAKLRNDRGDLSHGRSTPKLMRSNVDLAELVVDVCDGVVCYLLKIVFTTDWSYLNEPKYDDNHNFNVMLDSENILPGITYSKALFDQDIISYKEQLKDYLSEQESAENDTSI